VSQREEEGIVDVERRREQAEYALGDPTIFPLEYTGWIKRYIEQSGIQLPASSIYGLPTIPPVAVGRIDLYAGSTPPKGFLVCDGSEKEIADYPALAAHLGDDWGPSTPTTFHLPDLSGLSIHPLLRYVITTG
jgi:hypothetical protein